MSKERSGIGMPACLELAYSSFPNLYAILVEAIGFTAPDNDDFSTCAPAKKRLEAKEAPA
jgi:hypothetical protein